MKCPPILRIRLRFLFGFLLALLDQALPSTSHVVCMKNANVQIVVKRLLYFWLTFAGISMQWSLFSFFFLFCRPASWPIARLEVALAFCSFARPVLFFLCPSADYESCCRSSNSRGAQWGFEARVGSLPQWGWALSAPTLVEIFCKNLLCIVLIIHRIADAVPDPPHVAQTTETRSPTVPTFGADKDLFNLLVGFTDGRSGD